MDAYKSNKNIIIALGIGSSETRVQVARAQELLDPFCSEADRVKHHITIQFVGLLILDHTMSVCTFE
jgi:hypothetical protein